MKKLLLLGREEAGKTSMHSIIFANYPAKETRKIGYTTDRSESNIRFMGSLILNLWDCGGQPTFMTNYFTTHREKIFNDVEVLIYVFDVSYPDIKSELVNYEKTMENLQEFSPNAKVFVLIHKMDKFKDETEKIDKFNRKKKSIEAVSAQFEKVTVKEYFGTSIWDETLYQAWSQIVQLMIPRMPYIQKILKEVCEACDCDEVVLFEKSTYLIITHLSLKGVKDMLRYERVSNVVKQFKLSCGKIGAQLNDIHVKNDNLSTIIKEFTKNIIIMMNYSNPEIEESLLHLNITRAGKFFEEHLETL
jgi:Ras-related GTP-binding protein A/B